MTRCRGCAAEIGPTEVPDCPTHRRKQGRPLTNADIAVLALEASHAPISLYDIRRIFHREFGWAPGEMSLNATVAQDRRCCWAGRGIYGLWRHGLAPGPRRLLDAARLVLSSRDASLTQDELAFTLRHIGYRFQAATLHRLLAQSPTITEPSWHRYTANSVGAPLHLELGLPLSAFETVTKRVARQTRAALKERRRRLATDRGLTGDDPVFTEGKLNTSAPYS
jgi:hypothetical protein